MNFTPELLAFQGAIISAHNVRQFSKITARGGNEEEILDILTRLYAFLQERRYITKDGVNESAEETMRKYAFYLVLNGDFKILEDLVELPGIDMTIWTLPTITKCLICEMFWGLHMEKYLHEIISMSYPILTLQVIEPFIEHIKNFSPTDFQKKISTIALACYKFIARQYFYEFDNQFVTNTLSEAYKYFLRCIMFFVTPPHEECLNQMTQDELYKFKGNNLYAMISLILECLAFYTSTDLLYRDGFHEIYELTFKPEEIKSAITEFKICDCPENNIHDCIQKCNIVLLDQCQKLVMEVSVDIYCAWSEFAENGKSMQQSVGELCHLLKTKVQKTSHLSEHPILEMLTQISRKPIDIHDIIKLADNETILDNVNSDADNRKLWIQVILGKEDLLHNTSFISCLDKYISEINTDQAIKLVTDIINALKSEEILEDTTKQIGINLFKTLPRTRKIELITDLFANKVLTNSFETANFEDHVTETFNKFTATSDADLSHVLNLFIQNPFKTYTKIISTASENVQQCEIMIRTIRLLEYYLEYYYKTDTDACLVKAVQFFSQRRLETDSQRDNFVKFVSELKKSKLISDAKLLLLIIMPNLHKGLLDKDMNVIQIQLQSLDLVYSVEELVAYRAPVLAMMAQVLQVTRWNITTFTNSAPIILEQALQLQNKMFETYQGEIPVKELTWLKEKLKKLTPLNMYYYRQLWNPEGNNYLEIITGQKNMPGDRLFIMVPKVLCSTTCREWMEVWDSLQHRERQANVDLFFNALTTLKTTEKAHRGPNTWACVLYCYRNLVNLIKNKFFTEPLPNIQVEFVLDRVINAVNHLDESEFDDITSIFLTLLAYIVERKADYTVDVTAFRNKIRNEQFSTMFQQMFSN